MGSGTSLSSCFKAALSKSRRQHCYTVICLHLAANKNFSEYSFSWHDAVPGKFFDGASAVVTLLANLGHLNNGITADFQTVADCHGAEVYAPGNDIFCKCSIFATLAGDFFSLENSQ